MLGGGILPVFSKQGPSGSFLQLDLSCGSNFRISGIPETWKRPVVNE